MKTTTIAIWLLSSALALTNLCWAGYVVDTAIKTSYQAESKQHVEDGLRTALRLLPVVARKETNRSKIIAAAREEGDEKWGCPFEKDGYVWSGGLGLKFDPAGTLIEAVCIGKPSENNGLERQPCVR